jgi:hypothetical protein
MLFADKIITTIEEERELAWEALKIAKENIKQ